MSPISKWLKALLPFWVAAAIFVPDQVSKGWITENLAYRQSLSIWPALDPWLTITHGHNSGAVFGILPGANLLFIIIAIVVIAVIIAFYHNLATNSLLVRLSLGLQLGGALGNLADRLRYGYVIDFVDFGLTPTIRWYTFNVADASLVTGVIVLAFCLLLAKPDLKMEQPDLSERIGE